MFVPVRKELFRWETPDPEADWMMVGHVVVGDSGCVLVDPPLVPGLLEYLARMGRVEGVVLTTLDHSRGASYIVGKTGARLYLPEQGENDVDERGLRILKEVPDHEVYRNGKVMGMKVYRLSDAGNRDLGMPSLNEFALLTDHMELIAGDFAIGSHDGRIMVSPEWFPPPRKEAVHQPAHNTLRELVRKTNAVSLLASHGFDIIGTLQTEAERL